MLLRYAILVIRGISSKVNSLEVLFQISIQRFILVILVNWLVVVIILIESFLIMIWQFIFHLSRLKLKVGVVIIRRESWNFNCRVTVRVVTNWLILLLGNVLSFHCAWLWPNLWNIFRWLLMWKISFIFNWIYLFWVTTSCISLIVGGRIIKFTRSLGNLIGLKYTGNSPLLLLIISLLSLCYHRFAFKFPVHRISSLRHLTYKFVLLLTFLLIWIISSAFIHILEILWLFAFCISLYAVLTSCWLLSTLKTIILRLYSSSCPLNSLCLLISSHYFAYLPTISHQFILSSISIFLFII